MTLNRPTELALNFVDYLGFENRRASCWNDLNLQAKSFALQLECLGVPIKYIGTGPKLSQNVLREVPGRQNTSLGAAGIAGLRSSEFDAELSMDTLRQEAI